MAEKDNTFQNTVDRLQESGLPLLLFKIDMA